MEIASDANGGPVRPCYPTHKQPIWLKPDPRRVITRPFILGEARIDTVVARTLLLDDEAVNELLQQVRSDYGARHKDIGRVLRDSVNDVAPYIDDFEKISAQRQLLIGSYFTMEYAIESTALFNPSIVPDPDQSGLNPGECRTIMSLRAVGEGHLSSIEFRRAILDAEGFMTLEATSRYVARPTIRRDARYDKHLFRLRVLAMGAPGPTASHEVHGTEYSESIINAILDPLDDQFTFDALAAAIHQYRQFEHESPAYAEMMLNRMNLLARANYEMEFPEDSLLSERVVFPVAINELRGIEDARFVRFAEDDGSCRYLATYTAYDGWNVMSQLLETNDFRRFKVHTLNGSYTNSKGMAFFPRRIGGKYAMISRVDGENLFIMYSDNLHFWDEVQFLYGPKHAWEFMQVGNCGSPLETDEGWLLLTHGVGPLRRYCIGALLLDREDPSKVIGELPQPLLAPDEEEREGYTPNVVYSCGAIIHNGRLVLPYAVSDFQTRVATIPVDDLLRALKNS